MKIFLFIHLYLCLTILMNVLPARAEIPCLCNRVYAPVCGTDGKTYDSQCDLNCEVETDHSLEIKHFGECE
ncbi:unnamed protein product [Diabrotica balteata]|uniref:Kazal-like domain-containing protein n=1 Tax=Diabrotica balteata TaxID=107213 RepID=A0A9N9SPC6_DIABA|nr:unnamed protein product [Diabrotica balteata]